MINTLALMAGLAGFVAFINAPASEGIPKESWRAGAAAVALAVLSRLLP